MSEKIVSLDEWKVSRENPLLFGEVAKAVAALCQGYREAKQMEKAKQLELPLKGAATSRTSAAAV